MPIVCTVAWRMSRPSSPSAFEMRWRMPTLVTGAHDDHRRIARTPRRRTPPTAARELRPGYDDDDGRSRARSARRASIASWWASARPRSAFTRSPVEPVLGHHDAELRRGDPTFVGVRLGAHHVEAVQREHPGDATEVAGRIRAHDGDHVATTRDVEFTDRHRRECLGVGKQPPRHLRRRRRHRGRDAPGRRVRRPGPPSSRPMPTGRWRASRPRSVHGAGRAPRPT